MNKISIRFFNDKEVRAIWDDKTSKWFFSVLDIVGVLRGEDNYEKNRNYWKYLKAKLKREKNQLGSVTTQFKFTAPDGRKRLANVLDYKGIIGLATGMCTALVHVLEICTVLLKNSAYVNGLFYCDIL